MAKIERGNIVFIYVIAPLSFDAEMCGNTNSLKGNYSLKALQTLKKAAKKTYYWYVLTVWERTIGTFTPYYWYVLR